MQYTLESIITQFEILKHKHILEHNFFIVGYFDAIVFVGYRSVVCISIPDLSIFLTVQIWICISVILIYGSGYGTVKPIISGSGSYLDIFVATEKICCQIDRYPLNH